MRDFCYILLPRSEAVLRPQGNEDCLLRTTTAWLQSSQVSSSPPCFMSAQSQSLARYTMPPPSLCNRIPNRYCHPWGPGLATIAKLFSVGNSRLYGQRDILFLDFHFSISWLLPCYQVHAYPSILEFPSFGKSFISLSPTSCFFSAVPVI